MDARGIRKIVEACPNLQELRACELERFDEAPVMSALWRANAVQRLHLAACPGLGDDAIRTLVLGPDPELDPFTNRPRTPPRRLLHLNLGRCTRLTDAALRALADNVPMLEGLELGGCVALTDVGFAALLPTLPRLTHLDLEECTEVTDATLVTLARGPAARRLTSVGVSYCENVGDPGVVELVRKCRALGNLECDNSEFPPYPSFKSPGRQSDRILPAARVSDLTLTEAAHAVRYRPHTPGIPPHPASLSPRVALRLVIYDCAAITWSGVRGILARNVEAAAHPTPTTSTLRPDLLQLKCFYGWQPTVDAHLSRVLRGDPAALASANRLESRWADHMLASEEGASTGAGAAARRRRRRAAMFAADDEDFGLGTAGFGFVGRRRGRGGCVVS